jgi:hypothetical protein
VTEPLLLDASLALEDVADVALRHRPVQLATAARSQPAPSSCPSTA